MAVLVSHDANPTATQADRVERLAYTMPEAAAAIGVCERTIWQAIKEGYLKASKIGRSVRIHRDELDRFLRASQR
jgi:excisionase family DNA binding protein